jgi:hypothetical protein
MNKPLLAALLVIALTGAVRAETADSILANKKQQTAQPLPRQGRPLLVLHPANAKVAHSPRLKNIDFNPCGRGSFMGGDGQCHPRLN